MKIVTTAAPKPAQRAVPRTSGELEDAYQAYLAENEDDIQSVRDNYPDPADGAEWMIGQFESWLQNRTGCSDADLEALDKSLGDELFDKVYNGLT